MGLDPNRHVAVASLGEDARYTLRTPSIRSKTSRAWAKDRFPGPAGIGHSRAGRSRWYTLRAVNLFYFPHDTLMAMGPTRLLAGSHFYANLRGTKPEQVFMRDMRAGTVVIADFDLGHAGSPNRTATSRYMLKFVGLRQ